MISVLMPVFNIERKENKTRDAVDSVLHQTYHDFELIIINDGSTDNTEQVLCAIQNKDIRIRIVTKDNGGVESARRYGLQCAKGDYILHMDQDDLFRTDAFEIFVRKIEETGADVVIANHIRFFYNPFLTFGKYRGQSMTAERVIDHNTFMRNYYISFFGINNLPVNIWNKMYRKSFLESIPVPPLTGHVIEDLSYNMHILPYAQRIVIIPDVLYYYRWGGYTNRYDKTILDSSLVGYKLKMNLIKKYELPDFKPSTAIELLNYLDTYFYQLIEYKLADREEFLKEAKRVLAIADVQDALDITRRFNRYHTTYIDAMLNYSNEDLYEYEMKVRNKNLCKLFLKKILLKV